MAVRAPFRAWAGALVDDQDAIVRPVTLALIFGGALYAVGYALLAQPAVDRSVTLPCAAALFALGAALFVLPKRQAWDAASGFASIAIVSVVLTRPDPTATIPLFFLWPMIALAYFRSRAEVIAALLWMTLFLLPVLIIAGTEADRTVAIGTLSTVAVMAVLVMIMRREETTLRSRLELASKTDPLTGLLNRRAFAAAFPPAAAPSDGRAPRGEAPRQASGVLVLLDLDHFKRFNDTHGHLAGDDALRRVAGALRAQRDPGGIVCRFGGEEFAVLLPGGDTARAEAFADRVAHALAAEPIATELRVQASFGIAAFAGHASLDHLLARADDALYAAKAAGRGRAAVWSDDDIRVGDPLAGAEAWWGYLASPHARASADAALAPVPADPGETVGNDGPVVQATTGATARRDRLIKCTTVAAFVGGSANTLIGPLLLPMPAHSAHWQYAIAAVLLASALVVGLLPGSVRVARVATFWGMVLIAAVIATCEPLVSAPMFYMWPAVIAAYFCSPRFLVASLGWAAITCIGGLLAGDGVVVGPLLFSGVMLNITLMSAVVSSMRWREGRLRAGLEHAAERDPLTGVLNRRAFEPRLGAVLEAARLAGTPVAAVIIDADHFKRFNDTNGHLVGDDALRRIAAALEAAAGPGDLVCRFGGEEFVVALASGGVDDAREYVARIADRLAGVRPLVTVSAGIALAGPNESGVPSSLLARADRALYAAKSAGRARAAWIGDDGWRVIVGERLGPLEALVDAGLEELQDLAA